MIVTIENRQIGGNRCYLAAEAGTTCNGEMKTAKELIDVAAEAGFDAIKFQAIDPEQISDKSTMYRYETAEGWTEENMYQMFKRLLFSPEQWQELADYTRSRGLVFFSTVDHLSGVDLLENCDVPLHKMGSWDITYEPLIIKIAKTGKPIMVDMGPAVLAEIVRFVDLAREHGSGEVILLHDFHTDRPEEMNMRNIPYLKDALGLPVGFSAPGRDDDLDIMAVAFEADVIEKRITLSRKTPGHHHALSLEPHELKPWVERIRFSEAALGVREVRPSKADLADAKKYYRSICASRSIKKDETYTMENLDGKRPGTGISTRYLELFLGKKAPHDLDALTLLTWDDI